jgi:lipoic acid synthetase
MTTSHRQKKPDWLRKRLPSGPEYERIRRLVRKSHLHTVCQEAQCPNIWECFSSRTATFLILGDRCTRNCRFCAVAHQPSGPPDPEEPRRVAEAVDRMQLGYVVITSVTRDDLTDGGAGHFARTIQEIRRKMPNAMVEVLIPDFQGRIESLETVLTAQPDVLNHNLETVPRLYDTVRPGADYHRSLQLLGNARRHDPDLPTKSGLMLGLGEKAAEIQQTLADLRTVDCRMLTLGQYLQPSKKHLPVARFVPPEEFDHWKTVAEEIGFSEVASGPFVRSSYHARELFEAAKT